MRNRWAEILAFALLGGLCAFAADSRPIWIATDFGLAAVMATTFATLLPPPKRNDV